ncbi:Uncharacterized protein AC499_1383 [Pseudomonas amygdali pv. lachrymans]|uniref:Uncharacterized protein n=1 Tax=Pseudomonas amygdali pv. lachrymans TaxID=53707 RepID=A0ABR5KUH6_PSEAV|nr:Uncharacterized protein AC499_0424 [Pseudomonas amygdali pv. lachrymans]KPC18181.1 Uncharacterized protein AC499_1383 [Pseudomonas amygdali pv. lachrymans]
MSTTDNLIADEKKSRSRYMFCCYAILAGFVGFYALLLKHPASVGETLVQLTLVMSGFLLVGVAISALIYKQFDLMRRVQIFIGDFNCVDIPRFNSEVEMLRESSVTSALGVLLMQSIAEQGRRPRLFEREIIEFLEKA